MSYLTVQYSIALCLGMQQEHDIENKTKINSPSFKTQHIILTHLELKIKITKYIYEINVL